jgi:leucine dehydrogenase
VIDSIFDRLAEMGHEQVSLFSDPESGYRGIIAIHDTTLGPSLGGTRFWSYDSDTDALIDALRLSRGMTFKAAMAGLKLGGGKAVIIGDCRTENRAPIFRAHGRHVDSLGGRYITAEDVGTSPADMEHVREETEHVAGLADRSGDPSPVTAFGVYRGMKACAKYHYGSDSLAGKTVAVQGVGHVGYYLCKLLHEEQAKLIVTDIDEARVRKVVSEFGAQAVAAEAIYDVEADIFAPCALGAIVNDKTLDRLKMPIIAGGANNQLAADRHGDVLHERGVVYAPDYVINGGGVINVYAEIAGWTSELAHAKASEIYDTILHVLETARNRGIATHRAADDLARERLAAARTQQKEPANPRSAAARQHGTAGAAL